MGVTAGYLPAEKILGFLFCSLLVAALISLFKILRKAKGGVRLAGPVLVSILLFLGRCVLKKGMVKSWHCAIQRKNMHS